mmetsp:Transcript_38587/g.102037  ORF Transcript_38587/g.102037 Transcript_38587/m.102037 type:complete len:264 (+) Transcript_38587:382-1173(+)
MLQAVERVVVRQAEHLGEVDRGEVARGVAGVEPLQHRQEGLVGPVRDLDLALARLRKTAVGEHGAEVLALRHKDGLVRVHVLALDDEGDVAEVRAVQEPTHVLDQPVHRDVVQRALLEAAHVEHVEVVEPLVPVEAAEDVDPLGADQGGAVPLPAGGRVGRLRGPGRADPLAFRDVQDVELVRPPLPVVAAEEEDLVADEVRRVAAEARGGRAHDLRLGPLQLLRVQDVQVREVLVPAVAAKQVEPRADHGHRVRVPRLRQGA